MSNYRKHIAFIFQIGKSNKIDFHLNLLANLQHHPTQLLGIYVLEKIILTYAFADFLINYILNLIHALLLAKQFVKLTFGLVYESNIAYH